MLRLRRWRGFHVWKAVEHSELELKRVKRAVDFGAFLIKVTFKALGTDTISMSEGMGESSLSETAMRGMEAVQGTERECSGQ